MTNGMMKTVKGMITGIVVGSAVSVAAVCAIKPKPKHTIRKKTANALDTMGNIMQNLADFTR